MYGQGDDSALYFISLPSGNPHCKAGTTAAALLLTGFGCGASARAGVPNSFPLSISASKRFKLFHYRRTVT